MKDREDADMVDPTAISDAEMDDGPAEKVRHGRPTPSGSEAEAEGSIVGSGSEGGDMGKHTMGWGERSAKISGAHMGRDSGDGGKTGEGFEAGGSLKKQGRGLQKDCC